MDQRPSSGGSSFESSEISSDKEKPLSKAMRAANGPSKSLTRVGAGNVGLGAGGNRRQMLADRERGRAATLGMEKLSSTMHNSKEVLSRAKSNFSKAGPSLRRQNCVSASKFSQKDIKQIKRIKSILDSLKSDRDKDSATSHNFSPQELKEMDSAQFRVGKDQTFGKDQLGEMLTPERGPGLRLRLRPQGSAARAQVSRDAAKTKDKEPKEGVEGNIKILEYSGEARREKKEKSGSGSSGSGSSSSSGDDDDSGSNNEIMENSVEDSSSSSGSSSSSKTSNPSKDQKNNQEKGNLNAEKPAAKEAQADFTQKRYVQEPEGMAQRGHPARRYDNLVDSQPGNEETVDDPVDERPEKVKEEIEKSQEEIENRLRKATSGSKSSESDQAKGRISNVVQEKIGNTQDLLFDPKAEAGLLRVSIEQGKSRTDPSGDSRVESVSPLPERRITVPSPNTRQLAESQPKELRQTIQKQHLVRHLIQNKQYKLARKMGARLSQLMTSGEYKKLKLSQLESSARSYDGTEGEPIQAQFAKTIENTPALDAGQFKAPSSSGDQKQKSRLDQILSSEPKSQASKIQSDRGNGIKGQSESKTKSKILSINSPIQRDSQTDAGIPAEQASEGRESRGPSQRSMPVRQSIEAIQMRVDLQQKDEGGVRASGGFQIVGGSSIQVGNEEGEYNNQNQDNTQQELAQSRSALQNLRKSKNKQIVQLPNQHQIEQSSRSNHTGSQAPHFGPHSVAGSQASINQRNSSMLQRQDDQNQITAMQTSSAIQPQGQSNGGLVQQRTQDQQSLDQQICSDALAEQSIENADLGNNGAANMKQNIGRQGVPAKTSEQSKPNQSSHSQARSQARSQAPSQSKSQPQSQKPLASFQNNDSQSRHSRPDGQQSQSHGSGPRRIVQPAQQQHSAT